MPDQILQQLSDERKELLREDQRTQQIPKEPHPRATPQTKTDKTRDDKIENPDPSSPTVAAKQTRTNPDTVAKQEKAGDNEASTVKADATAKSKAAEKPASAKAAEGATDKNAD